MYRKSSLGLSANELRSIWDQRSRSGIDLAVHLLSDHSAHGPELVRIRKRQLKQRAIRVSLRQARGNDELTLQLMRKRVKARRKLDESVDEYLAHVQRDLLDSTFRLDVLPGPLPKGQAKQTYRLRANTPDAAYFAGRILQRELRRAFNVRQNERHALVQAFAGAINGPWTKTVIRGDVEAFYESIPHETLMRTLGNNENLPSYMLEWTSDLLRSFALLSPERGNIGLPRGVGPSSAMADIYLQGFDRSIRDRPECVFFGRYVDDIFAVMAPMDAHGVAQRSWLATWDATLAPLGLNLSKKVSKRLEATVDPQGPQGPRVSLDLLGYKISHDTSTGITSTDIGERRKLRLQLRTERAFDVFIRSSQTEGESVRLLGARIRYLTGNARLRGSKRNAFTGIFFSNPLVTSASSLQSLDKYLRRQIRRLDSLGVDPKFINRLSQNSFVAGFNERRFVRFSDSDWRSIVSIWEDIE